MNIIEKITNAEQVVTDLYSELVEILKPYEIPTYRGEKAWMNGNVRIHLICNAYTDYENVLQIWDGTEEEDEYNHPFPAGDNYLINVYKYLRL